MVKDIRDSLVVKGKKIELADFIREQTKTRFKDRSAIFTEKSDINIVQKIAIKEQNHARCTVK